MPAKKKLPTLRWKRKAGEGSFLTYRGIFRKAKDNLILQQWDEAKNKYVDIPVVE